MPKLRALFDKDYFQMDFPLDCYIQIVVPMVKSDVYKEGKQQLPDMLRKSLEYMEIGNHEYYYNVRTLFKRVFKLIRFFSLSEISAFSNQ